VAHEKLFKDYLKGLVETAQRGDAREESFYPVLATFIENFATATGRKNLHVTIQPRPTEGGNPDFRVWDGQGEIVGYIEAIGEVKGVASSFLTPVTSDSGRTSRIIGLSPDGVKSVGYELLHPIGRQWIALDVGGESTPFP